MTLPTVSIRQVSHNQVYRCIRVLLITMYIMKFAPHHLIQRRQAAEFRRMKDGLDDADVLLHFNFLENFSCSHQEAIQSASNTHNASGASPLVPVPGIYFHSGSLPQRRRSRDARTDLTDHTKTTMVVYLEYLLNIYAVHGATTFCGVTA